MTVRDLIRRASTAARGVSGLDVRDLDREESGISIPPLHWPTEPPPSYDSIHSGQYIALWHDCVCVRWVDVHARVPAYVLVGE